MGINGHEHNGFLNNGHEPEPGPAVVRLSDVQPGQTAECFGLLVKVTSSKTKADKPYYLCQFRDRRVIRDAPVWHDSPMFAHAVNWADGQPYRLRVDCSMHPRFGLQFTLLSVRPVTESDAAEGYDFNDLVESSHRKLSEMWESLQRVIHSCIDDEPVRRLVVELLEANRDLFGRMPAASTLHHSFTSGLIEHVCSMARVASMVAKHYSIYYHNLNPPLNRSVVVAGAILHDIGKLRELEYHPAEAKYTKEGSLIGHIVLGRDMVREAARKVPDFPEETLLLLEHVILSHHGKREFGAPVLPSTIEALIVSFVDDLDAKVNIVARELQRPDAGPGAFTDKLWALDNRRMYRGIPLEPTTGDDQDEIAPA
jgi:3'-5' exoribonuclease